MATKIKPLTLCLLLILGVCNIASAAEPCEPGEKRLAEADVCIPKKLFTYLYCLQKSGGGRLEVTTVGSDIQHHNLQIKVEGQASGVFLKGGGGVGVTKEDAATATSQLQEKLDPTLARICKEFADDVIADAAPPPRPQPATPLPKPQSAGFGMDLDGWCRTQGYRAVANTGGTGDGWRCLPGEVPINMNRVCRDQFGTEYSAFLLTPPPGGPNDWVCRVRAK